MDFMEQVNASHILVKTEAEALEALKKINEGISFEQTAKYLSLCPSGKSGGSLGWFGKGMMVPEFEKACFSAKKGDIIGPVKTQFGYHLIKIIGIS
jgi:peptidyl-prolyl cis-trans isomerase C